MTGNTRYLTALFQNGEPTWFVLDPVPAGLSHPTFRMKVGTRHYFLNAAPPVLDAETGVTLIFLQAQTHHTVWGNSITPEGKEYQLARVDRADFENDSNWHRVDNPFEGFSVSTSGVRVATHDPLVRDLTGV